MQEEWKPIAGYEGLYEVSSFGKVRSVPRVDCNNVRRGGFVMRLQTDRYGYKYVMLSKDGNEKHEKVHRLVGFAFCDGYSEERHCINHKDENPSNNHCDNLEWATYSENINHGTRNKRVAHKVSYAKRRTVQQISPDGDIVAEYRNGAEAARQTGVCHTHIIGCCKGRANTAGGYLWRYAD